MTAHLAAIIVREGLQAMPPLEWMHIVRDDQRLTTSAKTVAFCLGLHADPQTRQACPGVKRLTWEAACSRRTVIAALGELEGRGLLYCTERGSQHGTVNTASKYLLTIDDNLRSRHAADRPRPARVSGYT